ncbi:hypothetical protein [Rhizobium halophytocola]|uniref:DUF2793 domain-containing protein n=1 Tax=Rhizobium halophytocola TaxID=735519 RepID=A0ABS4E3J3_9HYPH|nr:hypothetical protein [Rhizobium halophytocola]MBP1852515.1 hypothetical protein [Rhizobium halophytocola]
MSGNLLNWENKLVGNGAIPAEGKVTVAAATAEAKAAGEATVNFAEGEATLNGELGLGVEVGSIAADGSVKLIPARWADYLCDHTWLGGWEWSEQLCRYVETNEYDYGLVLGGSVQGAVGVSGKVKGRAEYKDGVWRAGGKVGIVPLVGGSVGGSMEAGKFGR